eukprot:TRINITY_DN9055_c0_g1_i1.p1 TRINITY_DN9055_c0_g1~~TRINITY_DN9055_c0_g1_i1.p1  ORF type:complete len:347 (+),score=31.04 TRINITY_DN9055_c0_g1_i1:68-1108(+)
MDLNNTLCACPVNLTNTTANSTDPCQIEGGEYNLGLHIASIFVILIMSLAGVTLPIVISRYPELVTLQRALFVGRFFGTGVILATGFVHIFPSAAQTLVDPCLPSWFTESYPASAGLFAMLSALMMHWIEWAAVAYQSTKTDKHTHNHTPTQRPRSESEARAKSREKCKRYTLEDEEGSHVHAPSLSQEKHRISTYVLEFGISIHSVVIGLTLGLATTEFRTLWIALIFHQFFEGIGLGYMLSEIDYSNNFYAFLNALTYSITTPTGIGIGIGVHLTSSSYAERTLASGILDALAAGILLYIGLVTLLSQPFSSDQFTKLPRWEQACCFLSLYSGATVMAILGIWA